MKGEHVELVKGVGVLAFGSLYSNLVMDTVLHTMEGRFPKTEANFSTIQIIFISRHLFLNLYEYTYYFSDEFLYRRQMALVKKGLWTA